ncbi:hypothetical protein [uncultured Dokdonia sp.]|uniref:hypothetical protein n=1 Tax=uncultured Dokdonia sp. TaxID=575653 RepID=UPI002606C931|nr:hypothetical protein [uncultured Dokdonia sp.]
MKNHSSKAGVALIQPVSNSKSNNQHLIYPPANRTSHFVKIARIKNKEKRSAAMQKAARTYNVFETSIEVRGAFSSIYDFSRWLTEHKNELSYSSIKRNIKRTALLTEAQEIFIWENLIYQIVEKQSSKVKESLKALLVANDFLKAINDFSQKSDGYFEDIVFTEEQHHRFTAIANATVVMTKELLQKDTSTAVATIKEQKQQVCEAECILIQNKIALYKEVLTELKKINTLYDNDFERGFQKALQQQTTTIANVADDLLQTKAPIIDVMTGEEVEKYIRIPPFLVEIKKPLQLQSILHKVKKASKEVIEDDLIPVCKTLLEAINLLRQSILYYQKCIDIFSSTRV